MFCDLKESGFGGFVRKRGIRKDCGVIELDGGHLMFSRRAVR